MGVEIERKFLVQNDTWRAQITRSEVMRQGYLISDEINSIRVRIGGEQAKLNIKSAVVGISRTEFEYPIPLTDAKIMLASLCRGPLVEKTRYWVPVGNHEWEIDVFSGENSGLIVAELELNSEQETFERPIWLGAEVTEDKRYYNSYLVLHPYQSWPDN